MGKNTKPTLVWESDWKAVFMFPIALQKCSTCKRPMMRLDRSWFVAEEQKQNMSEAGIMVYGHDVDGEAHCETCIQEGKPTFECAMCNQVRSVADMVPDDGYEGDRLCNFCFTTVSASKWAEKLEELRDAHQWDNY